MTKRQLHGYCFELLRMRSNLIDKVDDLRSEAFRPLAAESVNGTGRATVHDADIGSRAADEELALELLVPETETLNEVNAALERIRGGTFGVCETCGKPIAQARLIAVPYARQCIRCAREATE